MEHDKLEADIVLLGDISKDIIVIKDQSREAIGGAVYYGGIAASHMGLKTLVITKLREEDNHLLKDFEKYGVKYIANPSDETTGIKNTYISEDMEYRTCELSSGFVGLFNKDEIPEVDTKYFIICPLLAGEIDLDLLEHLYTKYPGKICLDIQGFVRVRENSKIDFCNLSQEEKEQILPKIEILKTDHAEAKTLTKKDKIEEAAFELAKMGPKEILLTHENGISVYANNKLSYFPWKYKQIKGRTGRGDTAFAAYIGSRITKNPEDSLKFAAALTSLKIEHPGPFKLSLNQVETLIQKEY